MKFIIYINFTEISNLKISNWTTTIASSLHDQNITTFKVLFSDLSIQIEKIKKRKLFYEIINVSFYLDDTHLITLIPKRESTLNDEMTYEYFIDLISGGLSNVDTAKVLKTNFSFIVLLVSQPLRNQINNLIKDQNQYILSNGKELFNFIRKPIAVNAIEDSLTIKKNKYFTKVKYRDK
jgi:hypothetical protein